MNQTNGSIQNKKKRSVYLNIKKPTRIKKISILKIKKPTKKKRTEPEPNLFWFNSIHNPKKNHLIQVHQKKKPNQAQSPWGRKLRTRALNTINFFWLAHLVLSMLSALTQWTKESASLGIRSITPYCLEAQILHTRLGLQWSGFMLKLK